MSKIKKIAFLDVDGILLNFNKLVFQHLSSAHGIEIPKDYIPKSWNFTELTPKGKKYVPWKKIIGIDWASHVKPFNNAKSFLDKLKRKGYHIVLITRLDQSMQILRMENLIKHGLHYDEIYFNEDSQIKADIMVTVLARYKPKEWIFADDKAASCLRVLDIKNKNSKVYSLEYPFNKSIIKNSPKELIWVKNEQELYQKILKDS